MKTMRAASIAVALSFSLAGCEGAPMNYLRTFGPAADPVAALGWGLALISCLVVFIIATLVLKSAGRARLPRGPMSDIAIERSGNGLRWIYIGTGLSIVVLLGIVVWTMFTLVAVARPVERAAFTIEIHANQWWWEARYIDNVSQRSFSTANELHIPVGMPVRLNLISNDVIHSFWIPALAGKTDVIPGQTNTAWLQANTAGTYRGQCTEYCGEQHAHMAEFAVAEPPATFQRWWNHELEDAAPPDTDLTRQGESTFLQHCAACHAVRGIQAGGIVGPDLTHVMRRSTIGAGALPNDASSLARWIENAQEVKPGCRMPTLNLSKSELAAVTAYVQTLT
jgi:cytochrome c oxidase subunit 2